MNVGIRYRDPIKFRHKHIPLPQNTGNGPDELLCEMRLVSDGSLKLEFEQLTERSILFKETDFEQHFADAIALSKDDYLVGNLIVRNFEVVHELEELRLRLISGSQQYAGHFIAVPRFCIKNFPFIVYGDYRQGKGFFLINVREATVQHLVKCSTSYRTPLCGFFV